MENRQISGMPKSVMQGNLQLPCDGNDMLCTLNCKTPTVWLRMSEAQPVEICGAWKKHGSVVMQSYALHIIP